MLSLPVPSAGLDSLAWSVMAAFGASLGGLANSKLGMRACFLLNSITFVVNAVFVRTVVVQVTGGPRGGGTGLGSQPARGDRAAARVARQAAAPGEEWDRFGSASKEASRGMVVVASEADLPSPGPTSPPRRGELALGRGEGSLRDAGRKIREGWWFITSKENRDIAFICTAKAWGGLLWGFADLVAVRFSHEPRFQTLGDSSQTMGFIFGSVGLGCIAGPILANYVTRLVKGVHE